MSNVVIRIELDGDAFAKDLVGPELARVLRSLAQQVKPIQRNDLEGHDFRAFDVNGNRCGRVDFYMDDPQVDAAEMEREQRDKVLRAFVTKMSNEDIVTTLIHCCDLMPSDKRDRYYLIEMLVQEMLLEENSPDPYITVDLLIEHFQGKY